MEMQGPSKWELLRLLLSGGPFLPRKRGESPEFSSAVVLAEASRVSALLLRRSPYIYSSAMPA